MDRYWVNDDRLPTFASPHPEFDLSEEAHSNNIDEHDDDDHDRAPDCSIDLLVPVLNGYDACDDLIRASDEVFEDVIPPGHEAQRIIQEPAGVT